MMVYCPIHPAANSGGLVYEHRLIMEQEIGRFLDSSEHIHHVDEDKRNNDINNLILTDVKNHAHIHKGKKEVVSCLVCGKDTKNKKYCSTKCMGIANRVVDRPSRGDLKDMIDKMNWCEIGRRFGVTDNAIRNWARSYNLID